MELRRPVLLGLTPGTGASQGAAAGTGSHPPTCAMVGPPAAADFGVRGFGSGSEMFTSFTQENDH